MGRVTHIVSVKLPASPVSVATEVRSYPLPPKSTPQQLTNQRQLTADFISLVHKCKKADGNGYIRSITGAGHVDRRAAGGRTIS